MADQVLKGECSLADEIAQILRERIINGDYSIGEKLVENKIAEELKVSRTPVREAFKHLTKENLIEYVPNKGCFAKGFEQSDLFDIYLYSHYRPPFLFLSITNGFTVKTHKAVMFKVI